MLVSGSLGGVDKRRRLTRGLSDTARSPEKTLREPLLMHFFYRVALVAAVIFFIGTAFFSPAQVQAQQPQQQQRVVETVTIQGNRRLRQEDILYYIQTRPGDAYSADQVGRDLQTILSLGFFDKVGTRVYTEEGPRGGLNVI